MVGVKGDGIAVWLKADYVLPRNTLDTCYSCLARFAARLDLFSAPNKRKTGKTLAVSPFGALTVLKSCTTHSASPAQLITCKSYYVCTAVCMYYSACFGVVARNGLPVGLVRHWL